jgi:hypothetical protein
MSNTTKQSLEIGTDYGRIFGLSAERGQHLIYQGGDSWLAQQPGSEKVVESAKTTASALAYIGKTAVRMGM